MFISGDAVFTHCKAKKSCFWGLGGGGVGGGGEESIETLKGSEYKL